MASSEDDEFDLELFLRNRSSEWSSDVIEQIVQGSSDDLDYAVFDTNQDKKSDKSKAASDFNEESDNGENILHFEYKITEQYAYINQFDHEMFQ